METGHHIRQLFGEAPCVPRESTARGMATYPREPAVIQPSPARLQLEDGSFLSAFDEFGEGGIIEARPPLRMIDGELTRRW